jgi:hypothetical protein
MKSRIILTLTALLIFGCATDTGDPKKDARGRATNEVGKQVFNALLSWGLNEGVAQMTGQNGQDAAAGAFGAAKSVAGGINISNIMRAYAGPEVAAKVDEQLAIANPQTPQQRSYFANVAGAALQLAANQLTKS